KAREAPCARGKGQSLVSFRKCRCGIALSHYKLIRGFVPPMRFEAGFAKFGAAVILPFAMILAGCSSSSVSVTISQAPPSSLGVSETASITATVAHDDSNSGVDWTVACTSTGACGTFNPAHTASGTATTYTAPSEVPTDGTVTITATSTAKT